MFRFAIRQFTCRSSAVSGRAFSSALLNAAWRARLQSLNGHRAAVTKRLFSTGTHPGDVKAIPFRLTPEEARRSFDASLASGLLAPSRLSKTITKTTELFLPFYMFDVGLQDCIATAQGGRQRTESYCMLLLLLLLLCLLSSWLIMLVLCVQTMCKHDQCKRAP